MTNHYVLSTSVSPNISVTCLLFYYWASKNVATVVITSILVNKPFKMTAGQHERKKGNITHFEQCICFHNFLPSTGCIVPKFGSDRNSDWRDGPILLTDLSKIVHNNSFRWPMGQP